MLAWSEDSMAGEQVLGALKWVVIVKVPHFTIVIGMILDVYAKFSVNL